VFAGDADGATAEFIDLFGGADFFGFVDCCFCFFSFGEALR
jgi:hypothetical protein